LANNLQKNEGTYIIPSVVAANVSITKSGRSGGSGGSDGMGSGGSGGSDGMGSGSLVIGLFLPALAYLSYKGRVNLKWITIETH